jgi:hypothetical protein
MKKIFAVALLLMSFASVALADGPGQWPPSAGIKPVERLATHFTDGPGQWPPAPIAKPTK